MGIGEVIKLIISVTVRVGFWASVIFAFMPLLTMIISAVLIALNGSVLMDLYYMVQLWAPFNFNVIFIWALAIALAFCVYWLAAKLYAFVSALINF